jgi:hypothetical protein
MGALHVHSRFLSNLSQLVSLSYSQNFEDCWYNRHEVGSTDISSLLDFRNFKVLSTLRRYYRTPL